MDFSTVCKQKGLSQRKTHAALQLFLMLTTVWDFPCSCLWVTLSSLLKCCWSYCAAGGLQGMKAAARRVHLPPGFCVTGERGSCLLLLEELSSAQGWDVWHSKPGREGKRMSHGLVGTAVEELGFCLWDGAKLQQWQDWGELPRAGWGVSVMLCEPFGNFQIGSKTGKKYLPCSDTTGRLICKLSCLMQLSNRSDFSWFKE